MVNNSNMATAAARILSYAEYAAIEHPVPYVVEFRGDHNRLLLFGSRHTSDPADPMFDELEQRFRSLKPSFALHEGTPPAIETQRDIAIRRHCEAGLIRHLAADCGIDTASMDIPLPVEAERLRRHVSRGDALVFLVVRQLASYNRKTLRMDFDGYFGDFFDLIAEPLGLGSIDWTLIGREHHRLLGRTLSPPAVTALDTDPLLNRTPLQRIASLSNRMRDEHMLRRLCETTRAHDCVFAAVGVSHAVMLEPALGAALGRARVGSD